MGDENSSLGDVTDAFVNQCLSEYEPAKLANRAIFKKFLQFQFAFQFIYQTNFIVYFPPKCRYIGDTVSIFS